MQPDDSGYHRALATDPAATGGAAAAAAIVVFYRRLLAAELPEPLAWHLVQVFADAIILGLVPDSHNRVQP